MINKDKLWKNKKIILCIIAGFVIAGLFLIGRLIAINMLEDGVDLKRGWREFFLLPVVYKSNNEQARHLKIGVITDTHVRPKRVNRSDTAIDAERYLTAKDSAPIEAFVKQMKEFQPDVIIHLGDIIEGTGDPDYLGELGLKMVKQQLEQVGVPILWVLGNHDLRSVTKDQFMKALEIDYLDGSFDIGDYRLIVLDANYNKSGEVEPDTDERLSSGFLPEKTLQWLEEQLDTPKATFVFCHYAMLNEIHTGERGRPRLSLSPIRKTRELLSDYKTTGVFNGHIEFRHFEEDDGVSYFSLPGTKKSKTYPGSFYELTIEKGKPQLKMFYQSEDNNGEYLNIDFTDEKTFLELKDI